MVKLHEIRSWSDVRTLLNVDVTTKIKHLIVVAGVATFVIVAGIWALKLNAQHDAARDRRVSDERAYFAAVDVYNTQVTQRSACLDRVQTRLDVRTIMLGFNASDVGQNDTLRGILEMIDSANPEPPSPVLVAALGLVESQDTAIERQRGRIDADYAPLDPADCPAEPVAPEIPDELDAAS